MPNDDDEALMAAYAALRTFSDEWREFRRTVNTAIGLLSSEVVRLQKYIDKKSDEDEAWRRLNTQERETRQRRTDRFLWGIVGVLITLTVLMIAVLAYVVGRQAGAALFAGLL